MILKDKKPFDIPENGPLGMKALREKFPDFFNKKRSVQFNFDPALKRIGKDSRGKTIEQWPREKYISRTAKVEVDGIRSVFQITANYKQDIHGNYTLNDMPVSIRRRGGVSMSDGVELLWFLWYCSNDIQNSANKITSPHALVAFEFAKEKAKERIGHRKLASQINNFILDEAQCDKEKLDLIIRVCLGMSTGEISSEEFRDLISSKVIAEPDFALEVKEVMDNLDSDLTDILAMLTELENQDVIKVDKMRWMYVNGEEEPVKICGVSPAEDNYERLAKVLLQDEEWMERLKDAYKAFK